MTAVTALSPRPRTLADTLPGAATRDTILVVGFALLTALAAQISIPLGFTPVPITKKTFAVLLAGGALRAQRAASASQFLYIALGAIGLPFYADGQGGWDVATGSTAGYLVGFVIAAGLVGLLAERGNAGGWRTAIPTFVVGMGGDLRLRGVVVGTAARPACCSLPDNEPSVWEFGVEPFLIGDVLKAGLAGLLLPAAWKVRTIVEGDRPER